jgi:hypothetical protein
MSRRTQHLLAAACLAAVVLVAGAGAAAPDQGVDDVRAARLALYGGATAAIVADALGVTSVAGKPLAAARAATVATESAKGSPGRTFSDRPPESAGNLALRWFPNVSENEPTVAVNPRDPDELVAGSHFIGDRGNRCVAHYSRNGGRSWSAIPIVMPQLTHQSECSDPVLAYAPDGSRVYYAYMDIDLASTFKILLSYSDDDGRTWSGPIVVLESPDADYVRPWIGTHVSTGGHGNRSWVYATATRFDFDDTTVDCHVDFARSSSKGLHWSSPTTLDNGNCGDAVATEVVVVHGARSQGGPGNGVLAAWYHSGADGLRQGAFQIRTRYSANNGATFGPIVTAVTDSFELQQFLGPGFSYHRWSDGMYPDVELAQNGSAHIVYTHDPEEGSTVEDGDIRYLSSSGPPYASWSKPATVNDDRSGRAQGWPALEAISEGHRVSLYAIWEDHRSSVEDNRTYDVFWGRRTGSSWSNRKLTDEQSLSDFVFLGDRYDVSIAEAEDDDDDPFVYAVWTDRRDEPSQFDFDDDVWGATLPPDD